MGEVELEGDDDDEEDDDEGQSGTEEGEDE